MLRTPAGRVGNDCIGGAGAGAAPAAWGKVVASARVASHTAAPRHSTGSAQPAESPAPPRGRVHAWTRSPLRAPPRSPCVAPDVVHRNVILWEACTRFVGGTGQLSAGAFDVLRLVRGVADAMHAASHSDTVHTWSPHWPPWDAAVHDAMRALERYCARPQVMIVRADATAPGAALLDAHAGRRTLATAVFGKALSDRRVLAGVLGLPISVRGGTARNLLRGRDRSGASGHNDPRDARHADRLGPLDGGCARRPPGGALSVGGGNSRSPVAAVRAAGTTGGGIPCCSRTTAGAVIAANSIDGRRADVDARSFDKRQPPTTVAPTPPRRRCIAPWCSTRRSKPHESSCRRSVDRVR